MQPAVGDGLLFIVEPDALIARRASDGRSAWTAAVDRDARRSRRCGTTAGWSSSTTTAQILAFRATDGHADLAARSRSPAHARAGARRGSRLRADRTTAASSRCASRPASRCGNGGSAGPPNDILALDDRLYVGSKDNFFYCLMAEERPRRLAVADRRRRHRPAGRRRSPHLFRVARQRAARAESRSAACSSGCAAAGPAGVGTGPRRRQAARRRTVAITPARSTRRMAASAGNLRARRRSSPPPPHIVADPIRRSCRRCSSSRAIIAKGAAVTPASAVDWSRMTTSR